MHTYFKRMRMIQLNNFLQCQIVWFDLALFSTPTRMYKARDFRCLKPDSTKVIVMLIFIEQLAFQLPACFQERLS